MPPVLPSLMKVLRRPALTVHILSALTTATTWMVAGATAKQYSAVPQFRNDAKHSVGPAFSTIARHRSNWSAIPDVALAWLDGSCSTHCQRPICSDGSDYVDGGLCSSKPSSNLQFPSFGTMPSVLLVQPSVQLPDIGQMVSHSRCRACMARRLMRHSLPTAYLC